MIRCSLQSNLAQLINGTSNDLHKLLKYFHGTAISAFFTKLFGLTYPDAFSKRAALYLNNWALKTSLLLTPESALGGWSLLNCHKLPGISE